MREWAVGLMERDNRKSHLAPQLSPATRELLNSSESPTFHVGLTDDRSFDTPTSGEIPIARAGISPRDGHSHGHTQNRSPTRNGTSSGRSGQPGLGPRVVTNSSIPRVGDYPHSAGPSATSGSSFSLPVRPAPPGGPLPPPPPRKETPDDMRRENRRQATFGIPPSSRGYMGDVYNGSSH